mmetsp:Transcript_6517/g.9671  ORF Transcript_6517/g.9671 Transcript_6517/m.9671 type:complete len:221 (+) Transcript_6517:848-1510(+)
MSLATPSKVETSIEMWLFSFSIVASAGSGWHSCSICSVSRLVSMSDSELSLEFLVELIRLMFSLIGGYLTFSKITFEGTRGLSIFRSSRSTTFMNSQYCSLHLSLYSLSIKEILFMLFSRCFLSSLTQYLIVLTCFLRVLGMSWISSSFFRFPASCEVIDSISLSWSTNCVAKVAISSKVLISIAILLGESARLSGSIFSIKFRSELCEVLSLVLETWSL